MSHYTTAQRLFSPERLWPTSLPEWIDVPEDPDPDEVLDLLDDQYAKAILRQTRDTALSAKEISTACDISVSTVYRRTERLVDCGLLAERRIAQSDGTHHSTYEARLDEVTVSLTDDGFEVTIDEKPTGDLADRFTDMWEGL
ncbi:Helix-turn-helix domain-containing protein [Natronoarchaeum philippinense]|uniref:Helix-turn-helix domain-containing protein n=1 Tax=Natronoarchaeum philippinense TaxID=558529 RepID=A0A285N8A7_NATPI|nr:winged helix-turn-helix domain-containing protein [Natronoarchaeum philippinense]SNZ04206.1 Helix-turn-helix domain-containing protein [Natronoarchaeum philippinense]